MNDAERDAAAGLSAAGATIDDDEEDRAAITARLAAARHVGGLSSAVAARRAALASPLAARPRALRRCARASRRAGGVAAVLGLPLALRLGHGRHSLAPARRSSIVRAGCPDRARLREAVEGGAPARGRRARRGDRRVARHGGDAARASGTRAVVLDVGRDLGDAAAARPASRPSARTPGRPSAPPSRTRAAIARASASVGGRRELEVEGHQRRARGDERGAARSGAARRGPKSGGARRAIRGQLGEAAAAQLGARAAAGERAVEEHGQPELVAQAVGDHERLGARGAAPAVVEEDDRRDVERADVRMRAALAPAGRSARPPRRAPATSAAASAPGAPASVNGRARRAVGRARGGHGEAVRAHGAARERGLHAAASARWTSRGWCISTTAPGARRWPRSPTASGPSSRCPCSAAWRAAARAQLRARGRDGLARRATPPDFRAPARCTQPQAPALRDGPPAAGGLQPRARLAAGCPRAP